MNDPNAGYALKHNTRVFTSYKKFQARADLQALLPALTAMLGPAWHEVPIRQALFPDVSVTLYCRAFRVEGAERVALLAAEGRRRPQRSARQRGWRRPSSATAIAQPGDFWLNRRRGLPKGRASYKSVL